MPKSKDEKRTKNNKINNSKIINNLIGNKKIKEINLTETNNSTYNNSSNNIPKINKNLDEQIEKYVDKKLMQLNLQIEEIDDLFNLDKYCEEKEKKMKKFLNIPFIKKNYEFVVKYNDDNYEEKIDKIQTQYKELK